MWRRKSPRTGRVGGRTTCRVVDHPESCRTADQPSTIPVGPAAAGVVVQKDGTYARGADPDVEALFKQQARETDRKKREAMLHQLQQMLYDRVRFGPLYEFIWPSGIGPRVAEHALMLIDPYPWSAPYEDVKLKR